jgi:hypothetical protein
MTSWNGCSLRIGKDHSIYESTREYDLIWRLEGLKFVCLLPTDITTHPQHVRCQFLSGGREYVMSN